MSSPPVTPRLQSISSSDTNSPDRGRQITGQDKSRAIDETERVESAALEVFTEPLPLMRGVSHSSSHPASLTSEFRMGVPYEKPKTGLSFDNTGRCLYNPPAIDPAYLARMRPLGGKKRPSHLLQKRVRREDHDRYIPSRRLLSLPPAQCAFRGIAPVSNSHLGMEYQCELAKAVFGVSQPPHIFPILRPSNLQAPAAHRILPNFAKNEVYSTSSVRILDAPGLENDFYKNPFALSNAANCFALALGGQVYLYDLSTNAVSALFPIDGVSLDKRAISLAFNQTGDRLAIGKENGSVELWDLRPDAQEKKWEICPAEMQEKPINSVLSAAFHDNSLFVGDSSGLMFKLDCNRGVCTRSWSIHMNDRLCSIVMSPNGAYLATGGNDNRIVVRNARTMEPIFEYKMQSAIKGIAFDPSGKPRIAFAGGTNDNRLLLIDFSEPENLEIDERQTDSQTTFLHWWKNRLIATHRNGSYEVFPVCSKDKMQLGFPKKISWNNTMILTSGIWEGPEGDMLILGNPDQERLDFIPLPKPQASKGPKFSSSIFDGPYSTIR